MRGGSAGWNPGLTVRFQKGGAVRVPFSVARPNAWMGQGMGQGPMKPVIPLKETEKEAENEKAKGAMETMVGELAALRKQNGTLLEELVELRKQNGELLERLSQMEGERKRERDEMSQRIAELGTTVSSLRKKDGESSGSEGEGKQKNKKKKKTHQGAPVDFHMADAGGAPK